eukprot:CAMPEP_0169233344 /NCGR_PEP_ID=MMETSP1016-20121227/27565_1 /TAXON_ID=342587 /ORGANISM="Karlodinium micrum, Strain CCMP2283" /LENGTH=783 /DNA_ID=CAMNT_0009312679 /DNA_START=257 /DNA_END=2604 /DNA_ORIENTATION=-
MACLVWTVACQSTDQDISQRSWAYAYVSPESSSLEQYITSLHLSLSILAGGPVSFTTTLVSEQWVFCLFYVIAWAMMGVLVNEIASIYAKMSERSVEVRYMLAEASSFMAYHKVPADLKTRIERYLQNMFNHKEHTEFRARLRDLLSQADGLHPELNLFIFGRALSAHPQLQLLSSGVLAQIADLCDLSYFPPGVVVMQPDWSPRTILYLRSGIMESYNELNDTHTVLKTSRPSLTRSGIHAASLAAGEWLFARHLLAPAGQPSNCAVSCKSFCEAISLDIATFNIMMDGQQEALLPKLRIHAAIQVDDVQQLSWALSESKVDIGSFLLDGGTILHACARLGASRCVHWISGSIPDGLEAHDANGKTPLEIARKCGKKSVIDALASFGANLQGSAENSPWVPLQKANHHNSLLQARSTETCESLIARLVKSHIDVTTWGSGGAKTVMDLLQEVQSGFTVIVESSEGKLVRVVGNARIKVHASCDRGERILSETEDAKWLKVKEHVVKLPMKKMHAGNLEAALQELWKSSLDLDAAFVARHFERGVELVYEEQKETGSYPGLQCVYVVHEVPYWVREPTNDELKFYGLPLGTSFEVQETQAEQQKRRHVFVWLQPTAKSVSSCLSAQLASAGIDTSSWTAGKKGEADLAKEINDGISMCMQLPRGGLVRAIQKVRVRITVALYGKIMALHLVEDTGNYGIASNSMKLPETVIQHQRLELALSHIWNGKLGLTLEFVDQHFERGAKTSYEEVANSDEYPGLSCMFVIHEIPFRVKSPLSESLSCL